MNPTGVQILVEFLDCGNSELLKDPKDMEKAVIKAIKKAGMKCTDIISRTLSPGLTVTAILTESHVAIHTYPEACHVSVDVFTCSSNIDKPKKMVDSLKKDLNSALLRYKILSRGNDIGDLEENSITCHSVVGLQTKYHAEKMLYRKQSKFQLIEIIQNPKFGRMLFLDKDLQVAEKDAYLYNEAMVDPVMKSSDHGDIVVAILGGGDGGVLHEVLSYEKGLKVYLVDIDKQVITASKKHLKSIHRDAFRHPKANIVDADANKWLDAGKEDLDIVIYDLTTHPESRTSQDRAHFLDDMFYRIGKRMAEDGKLSMQCCSEYDTETRDLVEVILKRYFKNIQFKAHFIPSFCEPWLFATAVVK